MIFFYCFLNFICQQLDDIFEWQISNDDKYPKRQRYNMNIRCLNCREMGHKIADCYKPPKVMKCHMCGTPGHREPRCPNTICLRVNCLNELIFFLRFYKSNF